MGRKQKVVDVLGFQDFWYITLGIPVVAFLIPLVFLGKTLDNGLLAYMPKFTVSLLYTTLYWLAIRQVFLIVRRRYPTQKDNNYRVLFTAIGTIISYFLISNTCLLITPHILPKEEIVPPNDFSLLVGSITTIIICVLLYESIFLYDRWKKSVLESERLRRAHVQSQLEGLKSQINPHFLFNSLNTLTYLIPEDEGKAVKFVQKLSKVYRYFLEIQDQQVIPLKEELDFLKAYVFLIKERFGENLRIHLNTPDHFLEMSIVPLSLQILFENAIKHNVISKSRPLTIELSINTQTDYLVVKNNLQKKRQVTPSTKIGLQNIKDRYAYFSNRPLFIEQTEASFTVKVPLIAVGVAV